MRKQLWSVALILGLAAGAPLAAQEPGNAPAQSGAEAEKSEPGMVGPDTPENRGGQGNPAPDQVIGPPSAGPVVNPGADGALLQGETAPAKHSEENAAKDARWWLDRGTALTDEQSREIFATLAGKGEADSSGTLHAEPSAVIPHDLTLHALPEDLTERIPYIRDFRFVTMDDKVVLIDPVNRVIAAVVEG